MSQTPWADSLIHDQIMEAGLDTTEGSLAAPSGSLVERLATFVDMPTEQVRGALVGIARQNKLERLKEKVRMIKDRRAAIMPNGEIVAIGTPDSMPYFYPENTSTQVGP
jgi:hypothetical protein